MVKQGKPDEPKVWALPAGGIEVGESYEQCCVREVNEETGYHVAVKNKLFTKRGRTYGIDVHVEYFAVELLGGEAKMQDPDQLIHEIAWQSVVDVVDLELSFPEDREFLIKYLSAFDKNGITL